MRASLKKDVLYVCGGIYSLNATGAIGYLFNTTKKVDKISTGTFCFWEDEINSDNWTYFYDFKTNKFKLIR